MTYFLPFHIITSISFQYISSPIFFATFSKFLIPNSRQLFKASFAAKLGFDWLAELSSAKLCWIKKYKTINAQEIRDIICCKAWLWFILESSSVKLCWLKKYKTINAQQISKEFCCKAWLRFICEIIISKIMLIQEIQDDECSEKLWWIPPI